MASTVHKALRDARIRTGLTQVELAEQLATSQGVVSARETGAQAGLPHEQIEAVVRATGVPLVVTPDGWDLYDPPAVTLRCFGSAPCGDPILVEDDEPTEVGIGDLTEGNFDPDRHYLLRADGDSMEPYIYAGDWMVVDHQRLPGFSDIIVVNLNGGCTVKRVAPERESGRMVLIPANPQHEPIVVAEWDEAQVQGVVVGVIRRYVSLVSRAPLVARQQARRGR